MARTHRLDDCGLCGGSAVVRVVRGVRVLVCFRCDRRRCECGHVDIGGNALHCANCRRPL